MWTDYFKLIKLRRGRVITPSHGEIDFRREDIPVEICKELFDRGFPYLELTELGKNELYPEKTNTKANMAQIPEKDLINQTEKKISQKQKRK